MTELAATVYFWSTQVSVMIKSKEDERDECMIERRDFGTYCSRDTLLCATGMQEVEIRSWSAAEVSGWCFSSE